MTIIILIRIAIGGLALWLLWRLLAPFIASKRPLPSRDQDEWGDVLDAIDDLPETTDPRPKADISAPSQQLPPQLEHSDTAPTVHFESTILREAERALSIVKEADETGRLAAYHEIATYEKLASLGDLEISEQTGEKLADILRQAQAMISPPHNPSSEPDADSQPPC